MVAATQIAESWVAVGSTQAAEVLLLVIQRALVIAFATAVVTDAHRLGSGAACQGLMVRGKRSRWKWVSHGREKGWRLPQRCQTVTTSRVRRCEVLGAAGRTEPEAASPACAGVNRRRGHGGALPSVLLAAGCSEGFVCE